MSEKHTCITDDGGTPNRHCYACEAEKKGVISIEKRVKHLEDALTVSMIVQRVKNLEDTLILQQTGTKCWLISMKKSLVWWKEAAQGYSLNILEAGLYTYKEMIDITKGDDENRQGVHLLTKKTEIDAALEKLERETSETVMKWKKALGVAND